MTNTFGTLVVGAVINTYDEEGAVVTTEVKNGDTLKNVVYYNGPYADEKETIESAEVLGFTAKTLDIPRGSTRVYDGIPTYNFDPDGNPYWGMIEETQAPEAIVVKVPVQPVDETAEGEDVTFVSRKLYVDRIESFETDEEGD